MEMIILKYNKHKLAIYTRKSKYSDKSESIESQINFCKQFAKVHYPDVKDFEIYVDEGFSGKNSDRPQYKKLLNDLKSDVFIALICYKVDRISRSLVDFTNLQEYLKKYDINIISASEGFDMSTPWGQAVLNILMIFAQLERNNISERIKDTMLHYGRQGRWTGGLTPTGFKSKTITYKDSFKHDKHMVILYPIENEIKIVKLIYEKYIQLHSLSSIESFLVKENIKTKKGNYFSVATIRDILINPVYAVADKNVYNFFLENGSEICNDEKEFDGNFSILPYNREDKKKLVTKPLNQWIIAISRHKGIIDGDTWVEIQNILYENRIKKPRTGTAQYGIFSGLIKCAECGSTMRIKNGRTRNNGEFKEFYYICNLKEISHLSKCNMKNLVGHEMEPIILNFIEEYAKNSNLFDELINKNKLKNSNIYNEKQEILNSYKNELTGKEKAIKNLVSQMSQALEGGAAKYIIQQINELDKEISTLKEKITVISIELSEEKEVELDYLALQKALMQITQIHNIKDTKIKRVLMKQIIEKMVWGGQSLTIYFKTGHSAVANFNELLKNENISKDDSLQTFYSNRF